MGTQIIDFYRGVKPDHRGRFLQEILAWPDDQLESVHDYVQWLFPLVEPSGFNVFAPVLDLPTTIQFRTQPDLQRNLRRSWLRMMGFYGLEVDESGARVHRGPNFDANSKRWLQAGNHNQLRITRILKSLTILGLHAEAQAFFRCLAEIYDEERSQPSPRIGDETFEYWENAVGEKS